VAIVAGVLYWKLRKTEKEKIELVEEKASLEEEIRELDQRVSAMQQELERKDLELSEKNRRVEELQKEVERTRALIRKYEEQGKISARQAEEMRYKTEQMAYYIQKYQERIRELEEENQQLRARTAELEQQVQEKESQTRQVQQEKERLEVKVKAASYLKAIQFRYALVKESGKEEWDTEFRARRIHKLKVCFTVLENDVAEPGERTAYVVISDPTGKPITNFAASSGYFTLMDTEQPFSAKATFRYNRARQEVCAVYERPADQELQKGTYTVSVFCEGVEIGRDQLSLK
jgi:myosin heavy subunit